MPDRMPNRILEDMLDRMPEDLPVRKYINVMVGITRSKIILYIMSDIWLEPILENIQKKSVYEQTALRTQKILHLESLPIA